MNDVVLHAELLEHVTNILASIVSDNGGGVSKQVTNLLQVHNNLFSVNPFQLIQPWISCVVVNNTVVVLLSVLEDIHSQHLHGQCCGDWDDSLSFLLRLILQAVWAGQNHLFDLFCHPRPKEFLSCSLKGFLNSLMNLVQLFQNFGS